MEISFLIGQREHSVKTIRGKTVFDVSVWKCVSVKCFAREYVSVHFDRPVVFMTVTLNVNQCNQIFLVINELDGLARGLSAEDIEQQKRADFVANQARFVCDWLSSHGKYIQSWNCGTYFAELFRVYSRQVIKVRSHTVISSVRFVFWRMNSSTYA